MRMLWARRVSRFQRWVRPAIMRAATWRVLWILAATGVLCGGGRVWAVWASVARVLSWARRWSRRIEGGGMLVGRTVGEEVGVFVVKLWGDGVGLLVDCDELDADVGLEGTGPSSKSPQSSKASSSQAGGWGLA